MVGNGHRIRTQVEAASLFKKFYICQLQFREFQQPGIKINFQ